MTPEALLSMPIEQRFRLFVQWLGNQPRNGRYPFCSVHNCAMCQFAKTVFAGQYTWITAGPTDINVGIRAGGKIAIKLIPELTSTKYELQKNVFGRAYEGLAHAAGLPRRGKWRLAAVRLIANAVRYKNPLAA